MLVECVPNFSEGRDQSVLDALAASLTSVPGVRLLDVQADPDHHRSVFTFAAAPEAALEAAFRAVGTARDRIDLTAHRGQHPRMGAADVVPFVPLSGVTMDDCVALARRLGERLGKELGIPVFLYERAATRPDRVNLADVRRGEFEGLREAMGKDPARDPDFGPRHVHPTAGATAVGARPFLVAYNVYLSGGGEAAAKAVAKEVRASGGGLPAVKALGLLVGGEPQVSMNLVDIDVTPPHVALGAVTRSARARGAEAAWSEIVGLVPERAVDAAAEAQLLLRDRVRPHVIEEKVRQGSGPSLGGFLDEVASSKPTPGGGTAAAVAGAMAAALVAMVGRLTTGRKKYAEVDGQFRDLTAEAESLRLALLRLGEEDARAFDAVSAAYAIPRDRAAERRTALQARLLEAIRVPLETLRASRQAARLARLAAESGNRNAVSDAGVAALLAGAAARGAAFNVRINVAALPDPSAGKAATAEAAALLAETDAEVSRATSAVESAIGA
jgi:glutamate formiminotransferase/formiminotetrahydrofolate cyclodeaminase